MSPKKAEIPQTVRARIISLRETGLSYREIMQKVNCSYGGVWDVIHRYENTKKLENAVRSGRPKKLTCRERREIIRKSQKSPFTSAPELAADLASTSGKIVHPQTIRNVLHSSEIYGRAPRKKPLISEGNRQKRLAFAKEYVNKPIGFWNSVIFSDESKFNLFGSDGKKYVWRKSGTELLAKNLRPTVKHGGGNRMVWGCMAASGVGNLVFIEGRMKATDYIDILRDNLKESAVKLGLSGSFVFQQDNDPKHTAGSTREWLLYNAPRRLMTPPQSPDMNVIENLWSFVDVRVRKHKISNAKDLDQALRAAWAEITPELTRTLVESMPRRLQAVIAANGMHTKY